MTELVPRPVACRDVAGAGPLPPPIAPVDPITELPIVILMPHSRCNCRCMMCDIWRLDTTKELKVSDVAGWMPEFERLGVRRVVLGGGEALMHSDLWPICEALREIGVIR